MAGVVRKARDGEGERRAIGRRGGAKGVEQAVALGRGERWRLAHEALAEEDGGDGGDSQLRDDGPLAAQVVQHADALLVEVRVGGREDDGAQWEAHVLGDRRLEPRLLLGAPRERPELEGAQRSQRNAIAVAVVGRCEGGAEQLEQRAPEQLGVAHLLPVRLQSGGGDAEQLRAPRRRERWRAAAVA